jgi:protein-L-isoaspartate(D-aspartate) O-methyltransferase
MASELRPRLANYSTAHGKDKLVLDFAEARSRMVDRQIAGRGVRDPDVLRAMGTVPREEFVADNVREYAYHDMPLSIGDGQTISQPYVVALMTELARLQPGDRVLDIGTGSGYAAAILAEIVARVFSIERLAALAELARERLAWLGYDNIEVRTGDGTLGWPEEAPFDAIIAAAGGFEVPPALKQQLVEGGRLVMPVGSQVRAQHLVRLVRRGGDNFDEEDFGGVWFVPLIGAQGWSKDERTDRTKT